ncbi:MAG: restriction endonuclease [Epulopiscium sp. Nele67-Bin004]|nr:MAG: restriction endonuclease [Epulopiscium sp. Nele67-Bin004]
MFYYPNREQAIKVQQTLETLYHGVGGFYYYGDDAWNYIEKFTGINLLEILQNIAESKE